MAIAATLTDGGSSGFQVESNTEITILDIAVKFTYQVPSFSVFQPNLRQVEIQVVAGDGSVLLFDAFIRADTTLENLSVPFSIIVEEFCFIPVSLKAYHIKLESYCPIYACATLELYNNIIYE